MPIDEETAFSTEPKGKTWEEEDLAELLPNLYQKFEQSHFKYVYTCSKPSNKRPVNVFKCLQAALEAVSEAFKCYSSNKGPNKHCEYL